MPNFASPVLWPHPQWMMSCDEVDFGRVRPGVPAEKAVLLTNVGAGAGALHCVLTSQAPWLQLRRGAAAAWEVSVEVRLQAGEELLLLVRANPEMAGGRYDGQSGEVKIESLETGIANAPDGEPNVRGRTELSPLRAKAYFLEPRFLTLQETKIEDPSGTTRISVEQSAGQSQKVTLESTGVSLGLSPKVEFRLGRSDGLPPRASLEGCTVTQGKQQWFDCALANRGDEQFLILKFFTANRQPGGTHALEIELRDSDELVEPVCLRWNMTVASPPLLGFEPLQIAAVATRPTTANLVLSNRGAGELLIDHARVPGEFASWLVLHPGVVWPVALAAGASQSLTIAALGKALSPGTAAVGHLEVSCNHMGRPVMRRVPVEAKVASHGVRVELNEDELAVVLDHNRSVEIPFQIFNEANETALVRVAVVDQSGAQPWLSCESGRLNLPGASQVRSSFTVSALEVPLPQKVAAHYEGVLMVVLLSGQAGAPTETQIWSRPVTLQVQPKPKRFGLF